MDGATPFPAEKGLNEPVCVFCGSSPGSSPIYAQAAKAVGEALAAERIPLVYGGGRRGLMGTVSKSALDKGGYVHGIVPKALVERATENTSLSATSSGPVPGDVLKSREGQGTDLLEDDVEGRLTVEVVDSMHVRKKKMAQLSQGGFVVLPGGYGTFEEMMEVITWNQLGIHRLPVVVLNVGGIYEPLKALLKNSVEAGFIRPDNLSLVQILDIPSSASIEEWGSVTLKALREWTFEDGTGYGLNWEVEKNIKEAEDQANSSSEDEPYDSSASKNVAQFSHGRKREDQDLRETQRVDQSASDDKRDDRGGNEEVTSLKQDKQDDRIESTDKRDDQILSTNERGDQNSSINQQADQSSGGDILEDHGQTSDEDQEDDRISRKHKRDEQYSLFTTFRFTSDQYRRPDLPINETDIPLLERHIARLKDAHEFFCDRDGGDVWGEWVGDQSLMETIVERIQAQEKVEKGDWRIRVLIHPASKFEIQMLPAPAEAGPFRYLPPNKIGASKLPRRPLILDPHDTDIAREPEYDTVARMYKTTSRSVYDEAAKRGGALHPDILHSEVLLHTSTHILESTTSNIALLSPAEHRQPKWLTPKLEVRKWPFLDGVMRRNLLAKGILREGEVTLKDWEEHKKKGGRVIGFNGLRGVWEAQAL